MPSAPRRVRRRRPRPLDTRRRSRSARRRKPTPNTEILPAPAAVSAPARTARFVKEAPGRFGQERYHPPDLRQGTPPGQLPPPLSRGRVGVGRNAGGQTTAGRYPPVVA